MQGGNISGIVIVVDMETGIATKVILIDDINEVCPYVGLIMGNYLYLAGMHNP